jgi:RNA ligase (TIGR02306 family)
MESEISKLTVEEFQTSRKLASIQTIKDIKEHTNSDNLALAVVLGWQVVVKKGEFKPGDQIIYFEIDSLLPAHEWSNFLADKKFKVKTIKLRGEISQGLIMPLSIIPEEELKQLTLEEGLNLTQTLGIKKYDDDSEEPIITLKGGIKLKVSSFPSDYIPKSDEPRIQSEPKLLTQFLNQPYYASLKYDGTSCTFILNPNDKQDFLICSRNQRREYNTEDLYSNLSDIYKIREKLEKVDGRYALQCEIYGPSVQNNYLGVKELKIAVYTVKDLKENRFLNMQEMIDVCKELDLPMVEIIEKGDSFNYDIQQLKKLAKGFYPGTKNHREGLVFRLQKDWNQYNRLSFKIINEDFLIKNNK